MREDVNEAGRLRNAKLREQYEENYVTVLENKTTEWNKVSYIMQM